MEHEEGCPCCHKTKERTEEEYTKLIHRLNRIEGQIRGIRGMVERSAASCWNRQSPTWMSMDFIRSVICCLRHWSSSRVGADTVMSTVI